MASIMREAAMIFKVIHSDSFNSGSLKAKIFII